MMTVGLFDAFSDVVFLRGRVMLAYIRNELIECALDTKKQVSLGQIMYAPINPPIPPFVWI